MQQAAPAERILQGAKGVVEAVGFARHARHAFVRARGVLERRAVVRRGAADRRHELTGTGVGRAVIDLDHRLAQLLVVDVLGRVRRVVQLVHVVLFEERKNHDRPRRPAFGVTADVVGDAAEREGFVAVVVVV